MKRNYYKLEVLFRYSFIEDTFVNSSLKEEGYYFYDDLQNNIFKRIKMDPLHKKLKRLYAEYLL